MITIATVFRTGGVYDHKYVNNLVNGVRDNITVPYKVVCLTDAPNGIENVDDIIPFRHNWPKWWGKLELFRPDLLQGRILYIDLDTFIVDNIDDVAGYDGRFCGLRDFYNEDEFASGIMAWESSPDVYKLYNEFAKNPEHHMKVHDVGGDQAFMRRFIRISDYFQDLYPKQVVSYKVNCVNGNSVKVPNNARIICFHGNPKPHNLNNDLRYYWKQT